MAVSPGKNFGPYEILAPLGAGEQGQAATQINIALNWFEELKRRVPTGQ